MTTVREATFEVLRRTGLTTVFANPGSTEVPLLGGWPDDLRFVLALHEGSVVGMATGWAIAHEAPAMVLLHTTAGLGNAVGALATARVNRAPLVVVVGQQDRRHLALEPFLTGRLEGLAGDYPVWTNQPVRAQDVPGAIARARHEAVTGRGPALVIVPMDDWDALADELAPAAPDVLLRGSKVDDEDLAPLVALLARAASPVLVVGAGADSPAAWDALVGLAELLECPVWQESFGARAGFPQDHPRFAGILPADRTRLRAALSPHDVVLAVGAPVFRQYPYEPGPLVELRTTVAVITDDPAEAHRSPAAVALLADPARACARLTDLVRAALPPTEISGMSSGVLIAVADPSVSGPADSGMSGVVDPNVLGAVDSGVSGTGGSGAVDDSGGLPQVPLRAAHVLRELAKRLAPETIVVEETPSSRPDLHRLLPARRPLGFLSAAMGGLGFALPAAVGLRMALPDRPVVAVVGDGSAIYGIQALWSAAHYRVGALFVVLANGRYAVMDRLAERSGRGKAPWPAFDEVSLAALARSFGCPAHRVSGYDDLIATLDEIVPTLHSREEPLLLDVAVIPDTEFHP
ncbi:benzoylformate decarboxylase [Acrocarpospora pleiomorpha]|uniref:Benzoylformate decarboxylase n=1 Tax=Acrocarpospora pleiomorpha TaxID=90975 RepID=A0A5M3XPT5_9ACTN|nr:thiamine pyrophosphate-dependent enzyme [Acrocarpospora pleiomorpha]GES21183.1 benzoylformate decarboxylase [Acrocarpospora pleiomorpha]